MKSALSRCTLVASLALAFACTPVLLAQQDDSSSRNDGNGQDFQQTVARVSSVMGDATFQRGDDPDHWQALAPNVPVTIGDRLYATAGGRVDWRRRAFARSSLRTRR